MTTNTLKGVDVSNWQKGLNLATLGVNFAIMKATEGLNYVDPTCNGFVQQATKKGMLWGTYHFARNNNPKVEADHYVKNTRGYLGKGIMVLDIEDNKIPNWGAYADKFTERVHQLTGIWPLVYTSAANLHRFRGYNTPKNCGLWLAGYPRRYASYPANTKPPYKPKPWANIAIWQCTDNGRLSGYSGALDLDIAYMDKTAWHKYAGQTSLPLDTTDYKALAYDVLLGKYGNGEQRAKTLGSKYSKTQNEVNKIDKIITDTIAGKYGNGNTRQQKITALGYNYNKIQELVNLRLK